MASERETEMLPLACRLISAAMPGIKGAKPQEREIQ